MSQLSLTAANVLKGANGQTSLGSLGAGITAVQGDVMWRQEDGTWAQADANDATFLSVINISNFQDRIRIALTAGSPGQPVVLLEPGDQAFAFGATDVSGNTLYLDDAAGKICNALSDLASGSRVIALGSVQTGATTMFVDLSFGGIK